MIPTVPVEPSSFADELSGIAHRLAAPPAPAPPARQAQSLAEGGTAVALLHIERALTGSGPWEVAHRWLDAVARGGVLATGASGLYQGAPAVAFALHIAGSDRTGRYAKARHALDRAVTALTHRRVDQALHRIARAELPHMTEFDVINGLTGIGAHLLRHTPDSEALPRVLAYLARLTQPVRHDGQTVPGWWVPHDPHGAVSAAFPGGHANLGLAHGITGPLALLALAARAGIVVDGHLEAIARICGWLDTWRQHDDTGTWWPQWVTRADARAGRPAQVGPRRPSWCYGTPGLARTQQLAGLALGDTTRRRLAERTLASCLTDQDQLDRIGDACLCHGWAGLLLTTWRAATDPPTPVLAEHIPRLVGALAAHAVTAQTPDDGLLEGRAGVALALHAAACGKPPASGWDTCLLIA